MRDRLNRFMMGRYGNDQLNQVLLVVGMALLIISIFGPNFLYIIALVLVVIAYYRMLSRKTYKRAEENERFMQSTAGIRSVFSKRRREHDRNKGYRIYKCPSCKQKIRVPKGKGKIEIRCRKCGTTFIKKT